MKKFEGKWLPPADKFKNACIEIVNSNLENFKRHPIYSSFIGNDLRNEQIAINFYRHVEKNYSYLLKEETLKQFLNNDRIGNPFTYNIDGIVISPGTLRFMRVLGDIIEIYDEMSDIIEIGSGYGGQSLIIKSYFNDINYTLVDIPESLSVAKRYLMENNFEPTFIDTNDVSVNDYYDLVISDYCLSELDVEGIEFYINNIINKCKYAYITANSMGILFDELVKQLNNIFDNVEIIPELPKTSNNDNHIIICKDN